MRFEWDAAKAAANAANHGVPFDAVHRFEFEDAYTLEDDRTEYGEIRWRSFGLIDRRLHVLVFVERAGAIRIISLRKANAREVRRYEQATQKSSS